MVPLICAKSSRKFFAFKNSLAYCLLFMGALCWKFSQCFSNDFGYENIFVQQLQTQAKTDDVLVSISASGNSPNIIKAVNWAKKNKLSTVGLSAFDGGELSKLVDLNIHVPTKIGEYGPAEDLHMVICGLVGSFFRAYFKDD